MLNGTIDNVMLVKDSRRALVNGLSVAMKRPCMLRGDELVHTHDPLADAPLSDELVRVIWSGARILGRDRASIWDGRLKIIGATVLGAEGYAFDGPQEGLTEVGASEVAWQSLTTGDEDGVTLRLSHLPGARMQFQTTPARFDLRLGALAREPWTLEAGGIAQRVSVQRLPDAAPPSEVEFEFVDPDSQPGMNAYWVRVVQDDGGRAWSSPIFVER